MKSQHSAVKLFCVRFRPCSFCYWLERLLLLHACRRNLSAKVKPNRQSQMIIPLVLRGMPSCGSIHRLSWWAQVLGNCQQLLDVSSLSCQPIRITGLTTCGSPLWAAHVHRFQHWEVSSWTHWFSSASPVCTMTNSWAVSLNCIK